MLAKWLKNLPHLYRSKFKFIVFCIGLTTLVIGYNYVDFNGTADRDSQAYLRPQQQQADNQIQSKNDPKRVNGYAIYGNRVAKKNQSKPNNNNNIIDLASIDFTPFSLKDTEAKSPVVADEKKPSAIIESIKPTAKPQVAKPSEAIKPDQEVHPDGGKVNQYSDKIATGPKKNSTKVMSSIFGGDLKPKRDRLENHEVLEMLKSLDKIVHLDLKGAQPKIEYYDEFIPFIKSHGAVGLLLEYEDTFPFEGELKEARHGLGYSLDDVGHIKRLAKDNGLYIIPLVQTYGHLEWILKLKKFAHLRDAAEFPQVITPCLEESYTVIFDMIDQVIAQHQDAPFFHIGCDEVYYKLMHPNCSAVRAEGDFTMAFMKHLIRVSAHVREKLPHAKIIFWDDMLHNMQTETLKTFKPQLMKYEIEPMMWGYMENVRAYFQPQLYEKYGEVFETIWIASAYKGATSELNVVTSVKHHYMNHVSWIDVMQEKVAKGIVRFRGIALTGWSRYDHFLELCDLLPVSIPSLVINMHVMQVGDLSETQRQEISNSLGCNYRIPWTPEEISEATRCTFPGHEVFEVVIRLPNLLRSFQADFEYGRKYVNILHLEYNYAHKARGREVLQKLMYTYRTLASFKRDFEKAGQVMYHNDTIAEWLLVYMVPQLDQLYNFLTKTQRILQETDWKPRPLPVVLKNYPDTL